MFVQMLVLGLIGCGVLMAGPAFAQTASQGAKPIKMVVLGDSLSAGLGLPASGAFPARLQKALKAKGIEVDMVNAGFPATPPRAAATGSTGRSRKAPKP